MKLFKQPWKTTALKRLIVSLIAILLPIYVLSMLIYNWGVRTLQDEISKSMISQVSMYFDGLEKDFERIQTLQLDSLTDENLNRLAGIPDSLNEIEKMQNVLRLQQRLNAIKNSSAYIRDVHAYIPTVGKVVSALTITEFDSASFEKLKFFPVRAKSPIIDVDGRLFISAAYPFTTQSSKKDPIFIVAVELSMDKLEEAVRSMKTTEDEGLLLISPQFVISTREDAAFDRDMTNSIYMDEQAHAARTVAVQGEHYLAVTTTSDFFGAVLCKYVPESSVFQPLSKYRSWFVLLAAAALVIIVIYSLYVYKYIHKPLDRLVRAFRRMEHGDFSVLIGHGHDDEFEYIYTRFNVMAENLRSLIDQVYKQQILTQRAELKQLQSQINPHFLYNSFFILNTMTRIGDYEQLEQFTNQLGEYYQFITRNSSDDVPLGREVSHARVYTEIQELRFSNRIRVRFDELPEQVGHLMVPRLIVQPIIENAFEHGLEKMAAKGMLIVSFEKTQHTLQIVVEDNGAKVSSELIDALNRSLAGQGQASETTALHNIHQRLRLKFGEGSGLIMDRSGIGGLKAVITIHLKDGGI